MSTGNWLLRRGKRPGHFRYVTPNGRAADARRAAQIDALAIPPGWSDVHVAATDRSAIQAWGYDVRGRKQYRYHPRDVQRGKWRKYYRVRQMGEDLPRIRRKLARDFRGRTLTRERVLAGIVRFLADGFFRVGNERYAKENHTFGLTTLLKKHVSVKGDSVVFDFIGKRSIRHRKTVVDRDLARFVEALLEAPGRRLFRYEDADGEWHDVDAAQVNDYLQSLASFPYSAKDFRTWGGTLRAATVLDDVGPAASEREANRNVVMAMRFVASELGNTPTICRASYVHPAVIEKYIEIGATIGLRGRRNGQRTSALGHSPEERALIRFLAKYFPERRRRRRVDES